MPRITKIVQVFVASPSDVRDERDILETLISELNRTWSRSLGVTFELIRWETHTYPAFGADPQAVINEQIGDTYDVFIGIIWARFGTPTARANSGTQEEFEKAIQRVSREGVTPEVMIYFKDSPISLSKIDPEQLKLVFEFRKTISERGGLYSVFDDAAGFQSSLRAHLAALGQKFAAPGLRKAEMSASSASATQSLDNEDFGYLDYIEVLNSRIGEVVSTLDVISRATQKLGEQTNQRVADIHEVTTLNFDIKSARNILKIIAGDMERYARILESNLPLITSSRSAAMNALANALAVYKDFSNGDTSGLATLRAQLTDLLTVSSASGQKLGNYILDVGISNVYRFGRFTGRFA